MKKSYSIFTFILMLLVGCSPDPEKPTVTTIEVTNVTNSSAEVVCDITDDGGADVTTRGVCWSTQEIPTIEADNTISSGNGIGSYNVVIDRLTSSVTYYVRAYAINSEGTSYGETKVFTTKKTIDTPTIQTNLVYGITSTSAICGGNVISDGGTEVTSRGVCWSTAENPTFDSDFSAGCGSGIGKFETEINNLTPNTTYYLRAYAVNAEGTSYGVTVVFTTNNSVGKPVVKTNEVSDITGTTVKCGGNVISDGGSEVTSRGVCWSKINSPTVEDGLSMGGGSGVGIFEIELSDLEPNTKYYVRAYAINNKGISYGEEVTFTTVDEVPPTSGTINGHDWIDLGLASGTKWATCNVGATSPTEYGEYYAWGEIYTKLEYTKDNCITHGIHMDDISGNPEYDVARYKWEATWRMPTKAEMKELEEDCEWIATTNNGVYGMKVVGPNGNSIFLPAGGHYGFDLCLTGVGSEGYFWCSKPYNNELENCAYDICFMGYYYGFGCGSMRHYGQNVRPVSD